MQDKIIDELREFCKDKAACDLYDPPTSAFYFVGRLLNKSNDELADILWPEEKEDGTMER